MKTGLYCVSLMFNMIPISVALLSQRRQVWENPQTLNQDEIKEAVLPSSSTQQLHASKENTSGLSETHPCCDVMSCVPGFPNLFGWTLTAVQCLDLSAGWHNSFCLLRALYLLEASLRTWNMSATHDREFRVKTVEASFSVMNEGDVISRHASVSIHAASGGVSHSAHRLITDDVYCTYCILWDGLSSVFGKH